LRIGGAANLVAMRSNVMGYKARCMTAVVGSAATLFISGCAVELPKSAMPAFRLTPPVEAASTPHPNMSKPIQAVSAN
jgi:hypothetical protein